MTEEQTYEIKEFNATEAGMADLIERYSIVPDATTPEGYQAVKEGLKELVTTRTSLEKMRKKLNEDDQARIKFRNGKAHELENKIVKLETPYKEAKKEIDDKEKLEQERLEKAEVARIVRITNVLSEIKGKINIPNTIKDIKESIDFVSAYNPEFGFDEFQEAAEHAINTTKAQLELMLETAKANEAENLRVKAEAEKQAEQAKLLAEQSKLMAEQQAKMEAEQQRMRDEIEAQQKKIKEELEALELAKKQEAEKLRLQQQAVQEEKEAEIQAQKDHEAKVLAEEALRVKLAGEEKDRMIKAKENKKRLTEDALELMNVKTALGNMLNEVSALAISAEPESMATIEHVSGCLSEAIELIDNSVTVQSQS